MTVQPFYSLELDDLKALREVVAYALKFGRPFLSPEVVRRLPDIQDSLTLFLVEAPRQDVAVHIISTA